MITKIRRNDFVVREARPEVESPRFPSSLSQVNVRVEGQVHPGGR